MSHSNPNYYNTEPPSSTTDWSQQQQSGTGQQHDYNYQNYYNYVPKWIHHLLMKNKRERNKVEQTLHPHPVLPAARIPAVLLMHTIHLTPKLKSLLLILQLNHMINPVTNRIFF